MVITQLIVLMIIMLVIIIVSAYFLSCFINLCHESQNRESELRLDNFGLTLENERLKEKIEWLESQNKGE